MGRKTALLWKVRGSGNLSRVSRNPTPPNSVVCVASLGGMQGQEGKAGALLIVSLLYLFPVKSGLAIGIWMQSSLKDRGSM